MTAQMHRLICAFVVRKQQSVCFFASRHMMLMPRLSQAGFRVVTRLFYKMTKMCPCSLHDVKHKHLMTTLTFNLSYDVILSSFKPITIKNACKSSLSTRLTTSMVHMNSQLLSCLIVNGLASSRYNVIVKTP